MLKTTTTALLLGSAGLLSALIAVPGAQAASIDTVKANVPKPQATCGNTGTLPQGAWLANKPCGYVVGTALAGTRFDNDLNAGRGNHFGRSHQSGGASTCAWTLPGSLTPTGRTTPDSCSSATAARIVHRRDIGRDFDNKPHVGNGAPTIKIDASRCRGFYNYFTDSSYTRGRLHDPVGHPLSAIGAYRYATLDRKAAMIRNSTGAATTWMFVARSCIASQLNGTTLSNAND